MISKALLGSAGFVLLAAIGGLEGRPAQAQAMSIAAAISPGTPGSRLREGLVLRIRRA